MGTTPKGIPYPEPTDPVANGAANMKALAEAVDPWLSRFQQGYAQGPAGNYADGTNLFNVAIAAHPLQRGLTAVFNALVTSNGALDLWLMLDGGQLSSYRHPGGAGNTQHVNYAIAYAVLTANAAHTLSVGVRGSTIGLFADAAFNQLTWHTFPI